MSTVAFVQKVNSKSGTNRNGNPYTLYSLKLSDKDGNELPGWYQCGFDRPPCKEGDYVKLEATPKGNNFDVVKGSIKVSKNPPAAPTPRSSSPSGASGTSKGGGRTQQNIHYQNSRTAAIGVVELLIDNKALPLVKADSKAGAESRYEVIVGAVNKLTVQFFNDLETLRLLETVSDAGEIDTSGDGELPDAEEFTDEEVPFDDEIPFGDDGDDDEFE